MTTTQALPRWDLTPFFPGVDSPECLRARTEMVAAIKTAVDLFDSVSAPGSDTAAGLEALIARLEDVNERTKLLGSYLSYHVAADSLDTAAQARLSAFQQDAIPINQLWPRITAWVGTLDIDAILGDAPQLRPYEFRLRRMHERARHLMSEAEENLAAELTLTGGDAWGRLHGDLTSQISVVVPLPGGDQEMPMSAVRNLAYDADREVRRRAYEAEIAAWDRNRVPIAAAMNSIKGQVNVLTRRRSWSSPLDEALFNALIDRESLDAMMSAARDAFPDFRRYMKAKARALGITQLAWYDLFAPLASDEAVWEWDKGEAFIIDNFRTYSDKLAEFAARAFRERWIDAEPRSGKRDGAFCGSVRGDESRILANYKSSFNGVSTLAHELGHGYHNLCLSTKPVLLRTASMTLAETASIFCETIIRRAGLAASSGAEQLGILEASLQGACQIVVDISSRFFFEQNVFDSRNARELSVDEFNGFMLDAQEQTYGDGLDPDLRHKYMWAMKPHYYSYGSFYNYPYMFGMLFGLGLYARYQQDPDAFKARYDDLLASTGSADAATLAERFGIDIHSKAFWKGSLDIVVEDIDLFERLVAGS